MNSSDTPTESTLFRDRLAVVILNWNGVSFLRDFLPGVVRCSRGDTVLREMGCEVSVIVADNASTDESVAYIRQTFASGEVSLIGLDRNYGFTGGYNRALARISEESPAEYYLLLNSDVQVTEGWLRPLISAMREHPSMAAMMPKLRSWSQPERFEYAGACGGYLDTLGYPFCRGRILGTVEPDNRQYDRPEVKEIFWASGAAFLVRASLYHRCGGLDEAFFAHMEEIDLCWRLKRQGYGIGVVPASVVYHVGGGALPASSPGKSYLNFRNNLAMLYKNLSGRRFALLYGIRFFIDTLQSLGYLFLGKSRFASAVWRGHRDFWRMRPQLDRHPEYGFKRVGEIYRGSIILRYLLGKRTFGNLM